MSDYINYPMTGNKEKDEQIFKNLAIHLQRSEYIQKAVKGILENALKEVLKEHKTDGKRSKKRSKRRSKRRYV